MPIQFEDIGRRLRAYRLGKNFTASEIAARIGVSRAAVYRLEKGELVKIETLEKLSALLDVSLPSLLGVGMEYYSNVVSFFERMRQLEEDAVQILGNFSPVSFLLLSDNYLVSLQEMLMEAAAPEPEAQRRAADEIAKLFDILRERRAAAARRRTPIVSVVGAQDIERFLRTGMIGRFDLPASVLAKRRAAARFEIERIADLFARQPIGVQVGLVEDMPPTQTFQVFEMREGAAVTLSPYRLGELPNISSGIAMVTSAPEAVQLFKRTITQQWERSHKGEAGAEILRAILHRTGERGTVTPLRSAPSRPPRPRRA